MLEKKYSNEVVCVESYFFPAYSDNAEALHQQLDKFEIQAGKHIICPVLINSNHWILVFVNVHEKVVKLFNSLKNDDKPEYRLPAEVVLGIIVAVNKGQDRDSWSTEIYESIAQVENECGAFAMSFAKECAMGLTDHKYTKISEIFILRYVIAYEILSDEFIVDKRLKKAIKKKL